MRLILTRHGETEENKQGIVQGHLPGTLSEEGKMQARKLAFRLKDEKIDAIYSSDLKRAADTAWEIAKYHPGAELIFSEKLREGFCGPNQGKNKKEIDWSKREGMETTESMQARSKEIISEAYTRYPGGTVVFVGHNGINKALMTAVRGMPHHAFEKVPKFDNTSVSIFDIGEKNEAKEVVFNCSSHLGLKWAHPSREESIKLYEEIGTPKNIIEHVLAVNKIAVFLAKKLSEKGIPLDIATIDSASLLHDLDKALWLKDKSIRHGYMTEKLLSEKGYSEIGYFARQHTCDMIKNKLRTWEEKIIAYADKRVLGSAIVPLKERLEYIHKKYPPKNKEDEALITRLNYELEKEIFLKLDIKPEDIKEEIL